MIRQEQQTLADIAVQHTGSIESLFDIARLNNIAVTDSDNMVIMMPAVVNKSVADFYRLNNHNPATLVEGIDKLMVTIIEGIDIVTIASQTQMKVIKT
jgi:hypothetical protein